MKERYMHTATDNLMLTEVWRSDSNVNEVCSSALKE